MRLFGVSCMIALGLAAATIPAAAQPASDAKSFPSQIVRITVPFSAGSVTDLLARIFADKLGERWGQHVIVENKPGIAGTGFAAKAAPDGYNLMLTSNGHTIIGLVNKNLPFDPVADFVGVVGIASMPTVMVVPPDLPATSLKDFIAYAKARPKQLNFASSGLASTSFIGAELFRQTAGLEMTHVPYRGAPEAQTAVMRNDAQMFFTFANIGADLIHTGKVRALAVATAQRLPVLPDVPTFAEAGLPAFTYDAWFGILAPAGTPPAIVRKINEDIVAVAALPDVQQRLAGQGVSFTPNSADQFNATVVNDSTRFKRLFEAAGLAN